MPSGCPTGVAVDLAAGRVGSALGDARGAQSSAVCPGGMQGFGGEINRIVRSDLIQLAGVAKAICPAILVPAVSQDPLAGCGGGSALGYAPQALLPGGVSQSTFCRDECILLEMNVSICQTWKDGIAAGVK